MARKPRLDAPGAVHHVMLRGNNGQEVFLDDRDRLAFCDLLADGVERFGHAVVAFCLMGNHVHLLVRTGPVPLSKIMQNIVFRVTARFNRRHVRRGHLFGGRFRSIIVDVDRYLLELVRYIHLNPVRAGLVQDAAEWAWSGHRSYLGQERLPFLETDWVLGMLAPTRRLARLRYDRFVRDGVGQSYRDDLHRGDEDARVLGDEEFAARILAGREASTSLVAPHLQCVASLVCDHFGVAMDDLALPTQARRLATARAIIALLAQEFRAASLTEVGRLVGRDVATMSWNVRRMRERAARDGVLAGEIEQLRAHVRLSGVTIQQA